MQRSLHIKSIAFHNFSEKAFFVLVFLVVITALLYAYFISATVLRVVDRTAALSEAKILDTKISILESEYMASGTVIDISGVKDLGYKEIAKVDYVERTASLGFANR